MTKPNAPFALALAALTFVALWAPTLSAPGATPAAAQTAAVLLPALA